MPTGTVDYPKSRGRIRS